MQSRRVTLQECETKLRQCQALKRPQIDRSVAFKNRIYVLGETEVIEHNDGQTDTQICLINEKQTNKSIGSKK